VITSVKTLLACAWSARRIQRYLDGERGVPLTVDEAHRLERHLAVCRRCATVLEGHLVLRRLLRGWSHRLEPDDAAIERVNRGLDRILAEEQR
jgi:anti-sigma factor RsiW